MCVCVTSVCVCVCVSQVISFIAVFLLTLPHGRHLQIVKVIQAVVHSRFGDAVAAGIFHGVQSTYRMRLKENPGIAWTTPFA